MIDSDANENVRELAQIIDNIHLDKLDSASSKVDEAKELLWTDCFRLVFIFDGNTFLPGKYQKIQKY